MSGVCFGLPIISYHTSFPKESQVSSRLLLSCPTTGLSSAFSPSMAGGVVQIRGYFRSRSVIPNKMFFPVL